MKSLLLFALLAFAAVDLEAVDARPLYENNFEKAEVGKLPDGFLALEGAFVVNEDGTNKFLELPGAPLDTFAVQFGPTTNVDVAMKARIFGTLKGRRYPTFGVGLGGVVGYRLQVSPGKKALEIYKDADLKTSTAFDWKSGEWSDLRLEIRKIGDATWKIAGTVSSAGSTETRVEFTVTEEPSSGRASVSGCPFSGTPIRFDDLTVKSLEK